MKKIEIRKNGTKRVFTVNEEPSKTDPSWKDECDANNIMANYIKTGQIRHLAKAQGLYADVSEIPDLGTALDQVTKAQFAFDSLPSDLRSRFGNSPISFIQFLQDDKNKDEAIKLGIIKPPADPPADPHLDQLKELTSILKKPKKSTPTSNDDE